MRTGQTVSSTGNSRPSRCRAVISIRVFSTGPSPVSRYRRIPRVWASRCCSGTISSANVFPIDFVARPAERRRGLRVPFPITRPSESIEINGSYAVSTICRALLFALPQRFLLPRSDSVMSRNTTTPPLTRPSGSVSGVAGDAQHHAVPARFIADEQFDARDRFAANRPGEGDFISG